MIMQRVCATEGQRRVFWPVFLKRTKHLSFFVGGTGNNLNCTNNNRTHQRMEMSVNQQPSCYKW